MSTISRCIKFWLPSVVLVSLLVPYIGHSLAAELQYPLSVAVSDSGTIYLADRNLPGVWKLEGETLTVYFQGSKRFRTPLNAIRCVAIDRQGKLWAGDSSTRDIYYFDDQGQPIGLTQKPAPQASNEAAPDTKTDNGECQDPSGAQPDAKSKDQDKDQGAEAKDAAKQDESPAAAAAPEKPRFIFGKIGIPMDLAFDKSGAIFVSDLEIHRVMKVSQDGSEVKEFAQIQAPRGLAIDADDNLWVISGRRLVKVTPAGEKTTIVEDGVFDFPHTVAIGPDKTVYVCDGYAKTIWKLPEGGKPEPLVRGEPLVNPVGMRYSGEQLFVVDPRAKAVFKVTLDGKVTKLPMTVANQ